MPETDKQLVPAIYDFMFKAIMLDPNNRDYLIWIIHFVTKIPLKNLQNITIENVEHTVSHKKGKQMRSDIIVSIDSHIINLEMNKDYYDGVFNKNDAYFAKLSASVYRDDIDYIDTKKVIQINFDNFSQFNGNKEIYKFIYKEEELNIELIESSIKYHIDLDFIRDTCYNKDVLLLSKFEKYILLLMAKTEKFALKVAGDDDILKKVSEKLKTLSEDKVIMGLYDAEVEAEKVMRTRLKSATNEGLEKGMKEGLEKGMQQGLEQGIQQGIQQGLEQGIQQGHNEKTMEIAKKMLDENISLDIICKITGLSIEEIQNLT